ncbi:quaternary ammonium compound efflux SMR transporter SugE [Frigidibacter sp. MR17.24]|uniref:quaternary ammonium compound efflux SMR transporter SugE n=1 Tax=Frigidibacter sp. MR17.24 TaxID=3127345 RepID=UPI00301308D2
MNPWLLVLLAGVLEVAWAIGLKASDGFTRLMPSVLTLVAAAASFVLLAQAMKSLPVGTAYAVWTGIGALGAAMLGIMIFGEAATPLRLAGIGLIVAGIIALKLAA